MSYFMTISNRLDQSKIPEQAELLPAETIQPYIAALASDLVVLDGGEIYLVHDKETGTSDILIADLVDALQEGSDTTGLAIVRVLEACFENATSFRIWLANNDPSAHKTSTTQASDMAFCFGGLLKNGKGTWWHARSAA